MADDAAARLYQAFVSQDPAGAIDVIERAKRAGVAQAQLFDQLFAPAMSLLGGAWASGAIDEYTFTQAAVVAEQITSFVIPPTAAGDTGITVLVGTMHHDHHTIDKDITAAALKEAGHRVIDLGVDVRPAEFLERAEETGARIVIVFAQLMSHRAVGVARARDVRGRRARRRRASSSRAVRSSPTRRSPRSVGANGVVARRRERAEARRQGRRARPEVAS